MVTTTKNTQRHVLRIVFFDAAFLKHRHMAAAYALSSSLVPEQCIGFPHNNSCISLSTTSEPCVNKTIQHLESLKKCISTHSAEDGGKKLKTSFPDLPGKHRSKTPSPPPPTRICVKGQSMFAMDKPDAAFSEEVIGIAINLAMRLEEDRVETVRTLEKEQCKTKELQTLLDIECERRLIVLEAAVQEEHDRCVQDVQELKWHVSYDTRQLARFQSNLDTIASKNEELKKEVTHFSAHLPLLEEKLVLEEDQMALISQEQTEGSDKLNQAKHHLMWMEDKSRQTHGRIAAEKVQMEQTLHEIQEKVHIVSDMLTVAAGEHTALVQRINSAHKAATDHSHRATVLDQNIENCKNQQSEVDRKILVLKEELSINDSEILRLQVYNDGLTKKLVEKEKALEGVYGEIVSSLQCAEQVMRKARDHNEDLHREADSLQEKIAIYEGQTKDDKASVERARKEMIKLDNQLSVSLQQFSRVKVEHQQLLEQVKDEEIKIGNAEHSLKSMIEKLQSQLKEEVQARVICEGRVKAVIGDLERMKIEGAAQVQRAEKIAMETEQLNLQQHEQVSIVEKENEIHQSVITNLIGQLESLTSECESRENELNQKRSALVSEESDLKNNIQRMMEAIAYTKERCGLLEKKWEDVSKSCLMVEHMEMETKAAIQGLQAQSNDLQERIANEEREEESWRAELAQITEFSSEAQRKHSMYLTEREELLKRQSEGLFEMLAVNSGLAQRYSHAQSEFVKIKTIALKALDERVNLEASLKDHTQLLALQMQVCNAMKKSYEQRGTKARQCVAKFIEQSTCNRQQLEELYSELQAAVTLMKGFLEHGLGQKKHANGKRTVTFGFNEKDLDGNSK